MYVKPRQGPRHCLLPPLLPKQNISLIQARRTALGPVLTLLQIHTIVVRWDKALGQIQLCICVRRCTRALWLYKTPSHLGTYWSAGWCSNTCVGGQSCVEGSCTCPTGQLLDGALDCKHGLGGLVKCDCSSVAIDKWRCGLRGVTNRCREKEI